MFQIKIALFSDQGRNLIVVPLDSSFSERPASQQTATMNALRDCASLAGLNSPVAVVWRSGNNQYFIAPEQWHTFLRRLKWNTIINHLNKVLVCEF